MSDKSKKFSDRLLDVINYIKQNYIGCNVLVISYDLGNDSGNVSEVYVTNYRGDLAEFKKSGMFDSSVFLTNGSDSDNILTRVNETTPNNELASTVEAASSVLTKHQIAWDMTDPIGLFISDFFSGVNGNNYPLFDGTIIIDINTQKMVMRTSKTSYVTKVMRTEFNLNDTDQKQSADDLLVKGNYEFPYELEDLSNTTIIETHEDA